MLHLARDHNSRDARPVVLKAITEDLEELLTEESRENLEKSIGEQLLGKFPGLRLTGEGASSDREVAAALAAVIVEQAQPKKKPVAGGGATPPPSGGQTWGKLAMDGVQGAMKGASEMFYWITLLDIAKALTSSGGE